MYSRRTLIAAAGGITFPSQRCAGEQRKEFVLESLAPAVWLAQHKQPPAYSSNAILFELERGLLVVDTHANPMVAEDLISQVRAEISQKPVQYVVYSHPHFDHILGTAAYRQRWPGVTVISSQSCRQSIEKMGADWYPTITKWLMVTLDQEAELLDPARKSAASVRWEQRREQIRLFSRALKGMVPILPDVTFDREMVVHDRFQTVHLLSFGRGHSDADVVIWSPSRKVAATGDFAYDALPFPGVSYPELWVRALGDLEKLDFARLGGGHGPAADRQCVTERRAYLEELTTLAIQARQQGKTMEQFSREVQPGKLVSLNGGIGEKYASEPRNLLNVPSAGVDPVRSFVVAVQENAAQIYARLALQ